MSLGDGGGEKEHLESWEDASCVTNCSLALKHVTIIFSFIKS